MKKLFYFGIALLFIACGGNKAGSSADGEGEGLESDSTLYGVCGEGTSMHNLQLITNMNDTLNIFIDDEDSVDMTSVVGEVLCGDRMAVTAHEDDNVLTANKVINITSLLGEWKSVDRDFDLTEDGGVISNVEDESDPWTSWQILNGHLLLNEDVYDIVKLSADSLKLENSVGVYDFERVKTNSEEEGTDSTTGEE